MVITAVLLHNENLYSFALQYGQEISIGSNKKDNIQIAEFASGQIVIKWKNTGVCVNARKAYNFEKEVVPLNTILVLNNATKTVLYLSSETSTSEKSIKLPYNCILKFGRSDSNDVVLKLPFVSSSHFVLKNEAGNVRVEDQGSTNGLFLNGKRVSIAKMKSGDVLSILSAQIKLINGTLTF